MQYLEVEVVARTALLFVHMLAFALAAGAIALGDYAIFSGRSVDAALLRKSARVVNLALAVLWGSGLGLIWLSTQFDPAAFTGKPKLLAKLTVVALLTLNGLGLNLLAFPRLAQPQSDPRGAAMLPAVLGAVSSTTWLFAAFVGVAKGLDSPLGYGGFMLLYGLALALGCSVGLRFVWPRLALQLPAQAPVVVGRPTGKRMRGVRQSA